MIRGNYNYMDFETEKGVDKKDIGFNSPKHMFNIGFGNNNVRNSNVGFDVSYRWQNELYWTSSFGSGYVDPYGTLDASFSYNVKKWNTAFRLGGSNLIGPSYRTNIGGPYVGKTIFAGFTYDGSVLGGSKKRNK